MQRALVHIGTHKTGTTSFQRFLIERAEMLERDQGVSPHRGMWIPSHVELGMLCLRPELLFPGRLLFPDSALPPVRDNLVAHVRSTIECPSETVVLSAEALSLVRTAREVVS